MYLRLSKFYRGIRCIFEVNRLGRPGNTGHLSTRKMGPRCVLLARDKYVYAKYRSNPKPLLLYLVHDCPPASVLLFPFFFLIN